MKTNGRRVVLILGLLVGVSLTATVGAPAVSGRATHVQHGQPYAHITDDAGHVPVEDRTGKRVGYALAQDLATDVSGDGHYPIVYDDDGTRIGVMAPGFVRDGDPITDTVTIIQGAKNDGSNH